MTQRQSDIPLSASMGSRVVKKPRRQDDSGLNVPQLLSHDKLDEVSNVEKLGKGTYGHVYKVYLDGKWMAAKFMLNKKKNKNFTKLIEREVHTLLKVSECSVPKYYGSIESPTLALDVPSVFEGTEYDYVILQELVVGKTLSHVIKNDKIDSKRAERYMKQLMSTLDCIHRNRILHVDIKPENIMVRKEDDTLVFVDFGLACLETVVDEDYLKKFSCDEWSGGTRFYMAPRKLKGQRVSKSIRDDDRWAVGLIGVELLMGMRIYDKYLLRFPNSKYDNSAEKFMKVGGIRMIHLVQGEMANFCQKKEMILWIAQLMNGSLSQSDHYNIFKCLYD